MTSAAYEDDAHDKKRGGSWVPKKKKNGYRASPNLLGKKKMKTITHFDILPQ